MNCSADGSRNFVCPVPPDCSRLGSDGVGSGYVELMGKYYDACQSFYSAVRCECGGSGVGVGDDVGGSEGLPRSTFVGEVGYGIESVVSQSTDGVGAFRFSGSSLRGFGAHDKGKVYTLKYAEKQFDRVVNLIRRLEGTGKVVDERTLSSRQYWKDIVSGLATAASSVSSSKKKLLELELVETKLSREKEQLAISQSFRLRQERLDADAAVVSGSLEAQRKRKQLENLRLDQQLKLWDNSDEAVDRRKREIVARSELNIAKYENMKERKSRAQEIERKENWREDASGIPSAQGSVKTASSSGSISADSSASQRAGSGNSFSGSSVSLSDPFGFYNCNGAIKDSSLAARAKGLSRAGYNLEQQRCIETKRADLKMYGCDFGSWDDAPVKVNSRVVAPRPSSTAGPDRIVRYHGL